jgi:hypothetical protein
MSVTVWEARATLSNEDQALPMLRVELEIVGRKFDQATVSLSRDVGDMVKILHLLVGVGSRPSPRFAHLEGTLSSQPRPPDHHEVEVKSLCLPAA